MMKLSIIIAILDSHEIVLRQIKLFKKLLLGKDCELIFIDDGSNPPLIDSVKNNFSESYINEDPVNTHNFSFGFPFRLLVTNDIRDWTQPLARNIGAKAAIGKNILFTDIDHILTEDAIRVAMEFKGNFMTFPRRYGSLDEEGNIIKGSFFSGWIYHVNTFVMDKSCFLERLHGYDPNTACNYGSDTRNILDKYDTLFKKGEVTSRTIGPIIFVYKDSSKRTDIFHSLERHLVK